ncbi:GerW family sporulation protein [Spirosoma jeollabukense]
MSSLNIEQLMRSFIDRFTGEASVRKVYGEPIVAGDKTIIPVARVSLGLGGGFGEGNLAAGKTTSDASGSSQGDGGGLGGGVMISPQGFIEVTPTETRYVPIGRVRYVVLGVAIGLVVSKLFNR